MVETVFIAAGGTGGHIVPGLALAEALHRRGLRVIWLGSDGMIDRKLLAKVPFKRLILPVRPLRGGGLVRKLMFPFSLLCSFLYCLGAYFRYFPKKVVATGGYASFPTGLFARFFAAELIVCEQNAAAGYVNRLLIPFAHVCYTAYPQVYGLEAYAAKVCCVGNVLRHTKWAEVGAQSMTSRSEKSILVLGGSQGSDCLNACMPEVFAKVAKKLGKQVFKVVHVCGCEDKVCALNKRYASLGISAQVMSFSQDMPSLYKNAYTVVSRSGALTVSEITVWGIPAIYVPLKHAADNHQYFNALYPNQMGAAYLVYEQDLNASNTLFLEQCLLQLIENQSEHEKMQKIALRMAKRDALSYVLDKHFPLEQSPVSKVPELGEDA